MTEPIPQTQKSDTLPKKRKRNCEIRSREYLSPNEIERLRKAARSFGRHPHRDDTLILLMYRHGLRVSEVVALRWDQVDLDHCLLHVKRVKNGIPSTHPLRGVEVRALRKLQRDYKSQQYLFMTEQRAPMGCRTVQRVVTRAGEIAELPFSIHAHMLRHSTGFYLANKGCDTRAIQSYLGHANINNTVIYTQLSPQRFNDFWDD